MTGSLLFVLGCIIAHIQGAAIDISTCGSAKGCFGFPAGCITDGQPCTVTATWKPNGNKISFELSVATASADYYAALGILEAGQSGMGKAFVMDCIGSSTQANSKVAYSMNSASKTNNPITDTTGLSAITTEYANGEVRCFFDRDQTISSNAANFLDLSAGNSHNIMLAWGDVNGGVKQYHFPTKRASAASPVDFTQTGVSKGSATRSVNFVKAHACLMIAAWILFAGTAITLARYYKDMWPGKNVPVYDKPIWFSFHSLCNTLAVLCTIIAFVLIFYFKQEWSDLSGQTPSVLRSHPILGVIVTACALIQPIMAIFRPHPGTPRRPIFNWMHWLVGTIAIIAGTLTVFSGLNLTSSSSFTATWMTRLLLAFVIFAFLVDIILEVMQCMVKKRKSEEMEMTAPGEPAKPSSSAPAASGLRSMLFGLYLLFAIGTTAALIVGIALK